MSKADVELQRAVAKGDLAAAKRALAKGADPTKPTSLPGESDDDPTSAVSEAAMRGTPAMLELLAAHGADLAAHDPKGDGTLLHAAALGVNVEALAFLLSRGVDPNLTDQLEQTPLHWLALEPEGARTRRAIELLLDHGVDPTKKNYLRHAATRSAHVAAVVRARASRAPRRAMRAGAGEPAPPSFDIEHLVDFDRHPPLVGAYARTIASLSKLLPRGVLGAKAKERWSRGGRALALEVTVSGKTRVLRPRVYRHGQMDLEVIPALNALLPRTSPKLYIAERTKVVALTDAEKKQKMRTGEIELLDARGFRRMREIFEDRDRELDEDDRAR